MNIENLKSTLNFIFCLSLNDLNLNSHMPLVLPYWTVQLESNMELLAPLLLPALQSRLPHAETLSLVLLFRPYSLSGPEVSV